MDHQEPQASQEPDDWTPVQEVQAGRTEAFETLVRRYEKPIFNLLYRLLGDGAEAEEGAQEVFLSAFRSIRTFRGEARFSTWLYRIAINQAKNRRKSRGADRRRLVPLDNVDDATSDGGGALSARLSDPGPNPAEEAERKERNRQVQRGLNSLKEDDALLILLHDFQEMAYEEIARLIDLPLGTVKSRLHRARRALKERLASYFDSAESKK